MERMLESLQKRGGYGQTFTFREKDPFFEEAPRLPAHLRGLLWRPFRMDGDAQARAWEIVCNLLDPLKSIVLWGPPGIGKTMLAVKILGTLARVDRIRTYEGREYRSPLISPSSYVSYPALARLIRTQYQSEEARRALWGLIHDYDYLLLDDLGLGGRGELTPAVYEGVEELIGSYYDRGAKLLITTNLDASAGEIGRLFGSRVASRLVEMSTLVDMSALKDQRAAMKSAVKV